MKMLRLTCLLMLMYAAIPVGAETPAVRQAEERLQNVRRLAEAGAASKKQVEQAELALRQAKDDDALSNMMNAQIAVEDLTEEQSSQATSAAQRLLEREQVLLAEQARLVGEGVAPRTSLEPFEHNVERARRMIAVAEERARSLAEIAALIRAEQDAADAQPEPSIADGPLGRITRFVGASKFGAEEFKAVVLEFEKKFDRKLPVSARGETALHRSMGFDHRNRVDVALSPDGVEGRWLMRYLEQQQIPFFAFRTAVAGQATAPHIHIGPPSARVRFTD